MKRISPAKINLYLAVTSKRPDGYHNLVSLMCPLALHDIVELDFNGPGITVRCDHPAVPEGPANLAHRAAELFFTTLGRPALPSANGVFINIRKQIPVAAGMGGGSSNAAAVLLGLNHYFNEPFSGKELRALGLKLGADVPFFILGKPAVATGIGEKLEPVNTLTSRPIVLINPGYGVSTAGVYKNLNLGLTKCGQKHKYFSFGDKNINLTRILCNDLETVAIEQYPEIGDLKAAMLDAGATAALMTGSGPTVFGLYKTELGAQAALALLNRNKNWRVLLTRLETG